MQSIRQTIGLAVGATLLLAAPAWGFDSGSTGQLGALNPSANVDIDLPANGVLDYDSINIPQTVRVTFKRNVTNTPVVIRVKNSATIAGTIDVSGSAGSPVGAAGGGSLADDGNPGLGGPGGYNGGRGAPARQPKGNPGLGPGGGGLGWSSFCSASYGYTFNVGGGGGGFGTAGTPVGPTIINCDGVSYAAAQAGATYGASQALPLIGGSGGGSGGGGSTYGGGGGGGGGGALLLAVTGTLTITSAGQILANGGSGATVAGYGAGSQGGGGSGGAIRLIASTLVSDGRLNANGGAGGTAESDTGASNYNAGTGGAGRIRVEANTITRIAGNVSPAASQSTTPGTVFVTGLPTLRIAKVGGQPVPTQPTGTRDVVLAAATPNPVTVDVETTGIPAGNTVLVAVTPQSALPYSKRTPALTGDSNLATASVPIDIPTGDSVLSATTTYQIVARLGDSLSRYAMGERVDKVRLSATLGGPSRITLITVSGREFDLPQAAWAALSSES